MKESTHRAVQAALLLAQFAIMLAGLAMGGSATKEGGALILLSIGCFGANLGWTMGGGE